jgi:protein tyrosine/serine phosphatase
MTVAELTTQKRPAAESGSATAAGRPRRAFVALAVAAVIAVGAVVAYRLQPKHLRTVVPGVMYRSATLPPEQLSDVVDRYGIRTVVNLRSQLENDKGDWHAVQSSMLESKGVDLVDLPMHTGHAPDRSALAGWLDVVADRTRHPVLVHCEYGVLRTSAMVAVFEMEFLGVSNEEAWDRYETFGGDLQPVIEQRMSGFLADYTPRGYTREVVGP